LEKINPQFPKLSDPALRELETVRAALAQASRNPDYGAHSRRRGFDG
jgi:hypothetical protein